MWTLAWRNIWRHRSRSLITILVVAFSVFLSLLMYGFSGALKNGIFELLTENSGHLVVRVKGWKSLRQFDKLLIPSATKKMAIIHNTVPDAEVKSLLEVPALLAGEKRSRGIQIIGSQAIPTEKARFAKDFLTEGTLPAEGSLDQITLGAALAQAVRVKLGETVYVIAPGTEGSGASVYRVVGLLDFPENTMEARVAYLSLAAAQELAAPGAVTAFELRFPSLKRLEDEGQLIDPQVRLAGGLDSGLSVETWRAANPGMAAYIDILEPYMVVFAALFFVLSGLLVVNTIYLSLVERIREFGVIIAVGADRWRIMRMVFLESLTLVATGSAVGGFLGLGSVALLSRGFSMPFGFSEIYAQLGLPVVMYASITVGEILFTVGFAFATALLAALWPAWVAGRLQPVEAMKHVA